MIGRVSAALDKTRTRLRPRRRFRLATRRARILPSFLVVGAQRAGTTSLFDYLGRHPDVASPAGGEESVAWAKELHFFDDKFWRGVDWYRSFFPTVAGQRVARLRGGDLVTGEATPYYLFHPAVPGRVAATLPEVRLVALLRDPIERAYSHYQLMCRKGLEQLSFEDAVTAEAERLAGEEERLIADPHYRSYHHRHHAYLARGLYADQLERWLGHFPREQLMVLHAEEFFARPAEMYAQVLAFLGLRPHRPDNFRHRNRASYAPIDPKLRARLEERLAEPNARLARLLGRDFGWGSSAPAAEQASERAR
jgi:Sulfotransferase domain